MELSVLSPQVRHTRAAGHDQPERRTGNVNDTYLAIFRNTFDERQVILQRMNRAVFEKPEH
jgi:hypothetical protein